MNRRELTRAHARVARSMDTLASSKERLNAEIRAAVASGATATELAELFGVSRNRAWQMIRTADGRGRAR